MSHTPNLKKNEFNVLMNLGFEMEVPEGDSINYADTKSRDEIEALEEKEGQPSIADQIDGSISPSNINDPSEPIPGESEWSQKNRMPAEEQESDDDKEDLFSLLHDRLLDHPLANQIKLERYVRRLRLINF